MRAPPAGAGRDRVAHHLGELAGRGERTGGHDGVRDAPGEALLAVARDHRRQLGFVVAVHDRGCGQVLLRVHAHVERRVEPVREAPLTAIELRAAHTEIHEDRHDLLPLAVLGDQIAEQLESSVHHLDSRPEGREPGPSGRHGVGITVDPEQTDVGPGFEQERGMTAAADRAVDEQPGRHRQEEFHHLPGHDREMRELRLHA